MLSFSRVHATICSGVKYMKITAEILFYILSKKYDVKSETIGKKGILLKGIRMYRVGTEIKEGILYVLAESLIKDFFAAEDRRNQTLCFLICEDCNMNIEEKQENHALWKKRVCEKEVSAVVSGKLNVETVFEEVIDIRDHLQNWDAQFADDILHQVSNTKLFSMGIDVLPWKYSIVDCDMNNLYLTPGFNRFFHQTSDQSRIPQEIVQHLILQKEFHEVAKKREAFYYYDDSDNLYLLCRNIFRDEQYYARIIMYMQDGSKCVSDGLLEIFERFSDHIQDMYHFGKTAVHRHVNDRLHNLCRTIINGKKMEQNGIAEVLEKFGWKMNHSYSTIKLQFFAEMGWDSQLEITLPYLARELEREWKDSCAIYTGTEIFWTINMSLSGDDTDQHSFHQRVAYFVRDNVCNAGVSPHFMDFSLLADAFRAADAALIIGRKEDPHFWYYLFDDYRLTYMLEEMHKILPESMLCHPAKKQLTEYDKVHHTELSRTLEAYLTNNLNMTTAAAALYIHRTTFCRRMDHIYRLTELDLTDNDTILLLLLSYRLQK